MRGFNHPTRFHVLPIIFAQMFNYGIIRPSIPGIELEFFDQSYSKSSLVAGVVDAIGALLAFFTLPIFGAYSDVYGRRPVLALKLVFTSLPVISLCGYPEYVSLWYFFAAQIITKISTFSSVYAYVADVTLPEHRSAAFGQVSATVFIALTCGPLVAKVTTMHNSFVIAACISVCNICYCWFIMPESVVLPQSIPSRVADDDSKSISSALLPRNYSNASEDEEKEIDVGGDRSRFSRVPSSEHSSIATTAHHSSSSPLMTLQFMFRSPIYTVIFFMVFLEQVATYGIGEIFLLYMMNVLNFTRADNINFLSVGGLISCFIMLVLLPLANRIVGEKKLILMCIVAYAFYSFMYLFVDQIWEAYALLFFAAFSTMSFPATGSLLSMYVSKDEMGLAQGALSGIRSLSLGVGPLVFSMVFSYFTRDSLDEKYPAAPFALAFVLTVISFFIAIRIPDAPVEIRRKESTEPIFAAIASTDDEATESLLRRPIDAKTKA